MARHFRTQTERDQEQLEKYVDSYNIKLNMKRKLEEQRKKAIASHEERIAKLDEKLAPIQEKLSDLHKRVALTAQLTGDDLDDLIEPFESSDEDSTNDDVEFDEAGAFSQENDKPVLYPEYEAELDESFAREDEPISHEDDED